VQDQLATSHYHENYSCVETNRDEARMPDDEAGCISMVCLSFKLLFGKKKMSLVYLYYALDLNSEEQTNKFY
jgi:hypothetical protein